MKKDRTHDHFASLAAGIPGVRSILDAPCGPGFISRRLKDKGYEVTPSDIFPEDFQHKDMVCDKADLNGRLPYADGSFDLVVCREGIEHVENQFHTLREFKRVIKPGGWLLFSTPNILCIRARISFLLVSGRNIKDRPALDHYPTYIGDHINLRSYLDLRLPLRRNGFSIDRVTTFKYSATSMLWCFLVPIMMLFSWLAFRREKDPKQREANKEIFSHLFSGALLFGQKLIVIARKETAP